MVMKSAVFSYLANVVAFTLPGDQRTFDNDIEVQSIWLDFLVIGVLLYHQSPK